MTSRPAFLTTVPAKDQAIACGFSSRCGPTCLVRARSALVLIVALLAMGTPAAVMARDFDDVVIEATSLRFGLHMLTGQGGNILVAAGPDGVMLVDDQYAPLAPKIRDAVSRIDRGPIRWVLNTHWHADHTGGNEAMAAAGGVIVAHDNVRVRMSSEQFLAAFDRVVPASPEAALPVVTFSDAMSFHFNGDVVRVMHVAPAHTDGDAFVVFGRADVVHAGDVFFNGAYPFFDASSGGRYEGVITAANRLLGLVGEETLIVPGHGQLARRPDLVAYRDMLVAVHGAVSSAIRAGKSREETIASHPTRGLDGRWGGGFMTPDVFVGLVYDSLVGPEIAEKHEKHGAAHD